MPSSASKPITGSQPTSVYLYFDASKILIYVGITATGIMRNRQHNADKEWWRFVASQRVEHYETREQAHLREVHLITKFRPPFNRQHNPSYVDDRAIYLAAQSAGVFAIVPENAEDIIVRQGRRTMSLVPVLDDHKWSFVSHIDDAVLATYLRHSKNVGIFTDANTHIGKATELTSAFGVVSVGTSLEAADVPSISKVEARLRIVSLKPPVLELRRIAVEL